MVDLPQPEVPWRPSRGWGSRLREATAALVCALAAGSILAVFAWLVGDIVRAGAGALSLSFLMERPSDAGRSGGILTILVSTGLVIAVALAVAVPLGVGAAAWLAECTTATSRRRRLVRRSLDLLASIPSIVFGLFGMVFFCQTLGLGYSILAGGLTLAVMVLPLVVQTTYAGLRSVPDELRQGAVALGMSRLTILTRLLLPGAGYGVVIGVILALSRAMAETAALIFTSGYVTRMPTSLLDSGRTLSVHIYDLAMNVPGGERRAYATALVLLGFLLSINLLASLLTHRWLQRRGSL